MLETYPSKFSGGDTMTPQQILAQPARVLSQQQREFYFKHGYVMIERLISPAWLDRLNSLTEEFVERSKSETQSGNVFDIAPGHSAERPRMRRLKRPDERHPLYWEFACDVIADVAADLVGPDVLFHHSKLNFKWNDGKDAVGWHQDIQFYPHTNYSPLTIGTYLHDTEADDGAVTIIPGSQEGPLYDQYNSKGQWAGQLSAQDSATLDVSRVATLTGPAGSITVHNCRTVHGSLPTKREQSRPLLLNAYSSADALAYTPHPDPSAHAYEVVRGERARWAHHDARPCQIPPDWSGGYTSIFAAQAGEPG
jgi:ectoine hydroxylase-related dioxygenase (phytanoyl-CoA dioxygenase family)